MKPNGSRCCARWMSSYCPPWLKGCPYRCSKRWPAASHRWPPTWARTVRRCAARASWSTPRISMDSCTSHCAPLSNFLTSAPSLAGVRGLALWSATASLTTLIACWRSTVSYDQPPAQQRPDSAQLGPPPQVPNSRSQESVLISTTCNSDPVETLGHSLVPSYCDPIPSTPPTAQPLEGIPGGRGRFADCASAMQVANGNEFFATRIYHRFRWPNCCVVTKQFPRHHCALLMS